MANTFVERYVLRGDDQTRAAVTSAQKNFQRLDRTVAALRVSMAGVAAAFVINRAAGFTRDTLGMAESLADVSTKAGVTAEQLQVLRFAADQNGSSAEQLDKTLIRLQASIGLAGREALGLESSASPAGQAMRTLGVQVLDAGGNIRSTGEVFPELIDALGAVQNPAERAALAAQVFGKRIGPDLAVLIEGGSKSLGDYEARLRRVGALLSNELVAKAAATKDQFDAVGVAVRANFQEGFLQGFLGNFEDLNAAVTDPQFVAAINDMGAAFGTAMKAVVEFGPQVVQHWRDIRDAIIVIQAAKLGALFGPAGALAGLAVGAAGVIALRASDTDTDGATGAAPKPAPRGGKIDLAQDDGQLLRLRNLADAAGDRVQRETAYSQQLTALKEAETKSIIEALSRQKEAYDEATRAVADAQRERASLERTFADIQAEIKTGPQRPITSTLDVTRETATLRQRTGATITGLERGGSTRDAAAEADRVIERATRAAEAVQALVEGGTLSRATGSGQVAELERIASAASKIKETAGQINLDAAKAAFQDLTNQAAVLKTLPVGFDSAQTIADAQALRAAIQAELAANPIVVPVVLDRSGADTFAEQTVQAATVPGRAHGGYIPGRSPHPRADNILIRATAGELMIGRPEVDALRRTHGESVIAALLRGRLPGYAFGGLIGASAPRPTAPRPTAAAPPAGDTIHLTLPGVGTYTVQADRDTGRALQQAVRRAAIKSGNR